MNGGLPRILQLVGLAICITEIKKGVGILRIYHYDFLERGDLLIILARFVVSVTQVEPGVSIISFDLDCLLISIDRFRYLVPPKV